MRVLYLPVRYAPDLRSCRSNIKTQNTGKIRLTYVVHVNAGPAFWRQVAAHVSLYRDFDANLQLRGNKAFGPLITPIKLQPVNRVAGPEAV